jgi:hypothetical protein
MSDIRSKVAKSSFGTKHSLAARKTVSAARAAEIARRSAEIRQQKTAQEKH